MRQLFIIILIAIAAVALSLTVNTGAGQVAIFYPPYRVDLSLNLTIMLLIVGFLLFYGLFRAVSGAMRLPERVRAFKSGRRREGAHRALREAVLALVEGRYSKVERLASEASVEVADAEPTALLGAIAAQRLREFERRDRWLEPLADSVGPVAHAALLVRVESLAEQGDYQAALASIEPLLKGSRRNVRTLQMALDIYRGAGLWLEVLRFVRLLANRNALESFKVDQFTIEAYQHLCVERAEDTYALLALWRQAMPRELLLPEVIRHIALSMQKAGLSGQAKSILDEFLTQHWTPSLLDAYIQVGQHQPIASVEMAQRWLSEHPDETILLEVLGRLCVSQGQVDKAVDYFERLYVVRATPATAAQLAVLYEQQGKAEKEVFYAQQCVNLTLSPSA